LEEGDKADMQGLHVSGSVEGRVRGAVLGCVDQAELGHAGHPMGWWPWWSAGLSPRLGQVSWSCLVRVRVLKLNLKGTLQIQLPHKFNESNKIQIKPNSIRTKHFKVTNISLGWIDF
jgi:hypothetical protein